MDEDHHGLGPGIGPVTGVDKVEAGRGFAEVVVIAWRTSAITTAVIEAMQDEDGERVGDEVVGRRGDAKPVRILRVQPHRPIPVDEMEGTSANHEDAEEITHDSASFHTERSMPMGYPHTLEYAPPSGY